MTIIRYYAFHNDQSPRPSHYRESWYDEDTKEFVIHYGKVGEPGTINAETITDAEEAENLLVSFTSQCEQDGYQLLEDHQYEHLRVRFKLKAEHPSPVEQTQSKHLSTWITRILAWRGVGEVRDFQLDDGAYTYDVATVHAGKARKLIPEAIKNTDVRPNRVTIQGASR